VSARERRMVLLRIVRIVRTLCKGTGDKSACYHEEVKHLKPGMKEQCVNRSKKCNKRANKESLKRR